MSPGGSVTAVHTAPYRIRAPIVRDVPAGQCGTENGVVVYAALIMAQENLPRPYHRKERPFWKSASANRPGPGFRTAKSESDSRRGRTSGAAERQRAVGDSDAAETHCEGTAGAGLPLKGAVCGSRLGLRWRACAASAGVSGTRPVSKGYAPTKKAGPAARGRPLNFAVTGGYYSSTIGLYLGTRAFMMLHAST